MLPTHFLKRYFPTTPDWLLGGLFLVCLLWLGVLSAEILQALMGQDFLRPNVLGWVVRSFYIFGFSTSMFLVSPWTNSSLTLSDLRLVVVLLGLIISSPVYLIIGALLSIRKGIPITLGILLLLANILYGCYATLVIMLSAD